MKYLSKLFLFVLIIFFTKDITAKTDKYRCIWNVDPTTMTTIGWGQVSGTNPVVYYDTQDHGTDWSSYEYAQKYSHNILSKGIDNHFARLTSLMPGTIYYFVIKDSEGVSERFFFRTAPDHPYERISIIAGGDSRNNRASRQNANLLVSKLRPHCVMFAGDMTASDNSIEWPKWFDDWQLTISDDGRITPIITARGNHEYSNETLIKLFDAPNRHIYFSFSIGGNLLRIYTLNSMIAAGGDQAAWLESDLKANPESTWKFAHYHHPIRPHTKSKRDKDKQRTSWATLFHKYSVDMVVECDAHTVKTTWPIRPSVEEGSDAGFIRDDETGTVYIGEGCWGAPVRANNDDKAWTRASGRFNQFKWIFVDQNSVEARTVKTDNADMVASVDPYNVFVEPANLDVWNPPHGSVVRLENYPTLASTEPIAPLPPAPPVEPEPKKDETPAPVPPPIKEVTVPEEVVKIPKEKDIPPVVEEVTSSEKVAETSVKIPKEKDIPSEKPADIPPAAEEEEEVTPLNKVAETSVKIPKEKDIPSEKSTDIPEKVAPPPAPPKPVFVNQINGFNTRVEEDVVYFMITAKNETEKMFFELQRSSNNIYFKEVDLKTSAKPSKEEKKYSFVDDGALFLNSPKVYYRIKYGSNNAETRYSAVRSVQLTPWEDYYELELNPESNLLRIHYALQEVGDVDLHIYNSQGKEEIEQSFVEQKAGDYNRLVDLRGLASGIYLLQLRSGKESVIRRIVIP